MKLYWPEAIVIDNDKEQKMFTYDCCLTKEKAIDCIKIWSEIFSFVKCAWIDIDDTESEDYGKSERKLERIEAKEDEYKIIRRDE